ncbi:MAG: PD-(D/E)XK nuclease family protein [Candidatus Omnitrophica bacterium]|nr:PD-(D/E)XK nuclease family protein [Candidatus Omnitrophota bacterium]
MIENIFSWSKSTDEKFRDCARKYYYDKYLSWGGWESGASARTRSAYVLKNLKNRWAWRGERVHHVIEHVLKSLRQGRAVPLEEALSHLTRIMREDYLASKAKKYLENPKRNLGLFEHEYEKNIEDPVWKRVHEGAVECVQNFYRSDFFKELSEEDKAHWLLIEDLEAFTFDGAKIYVKLDFARRKNDAIEIIDWKTGKNENAAPSVQIGAYAIYAMQKWQVPLEGVRAYLFNLASPFPVPTLQILTPALIEATQNTMAESIGRMRSLLADPAKNIPKSADHFPFTEKPELCAQCNFYKICEKYCKS